MTDSLTYKTGTFEGPLDLLLSLISRNKMEIADIRITVIFDQYMAYLDEMHRMDMEIAGEFIVMASELMLIKSRMLLPKSDDPAEEDPRARLAEALLEYKKAKEASLYLEEQFSVYADRFAKDTDELPASADEIAPQDVKLLKRALLRLFSAKDREAPAPMHSLQPILQKTVVPVSVRLRSVTAQLTADGCIPFEALFVTVKTKSDLVATFLAVLTLIKDGYVLLEKRLGAAEEPDDTDPGYAYEFYCSMNPEQPVPETYMETYEEL